MDPLFSALYGDPTKWDNFASDYPTLNASFGKGTTAVPSLQSNLCRDGLAQLATRTPVALAFVSDAECDCIYVAHSITIFPADVTEATVMDNLAVGLLGDRPDSLVPVVFPQPFFSVCAAAVANNVATIVGAGAADTDPLRARRAVLLPPHLAGRALRQAPVDGRYTLLGFYNAFLRDTIAAGDVAATAALAPVIEWWRLASTDLAGGNTAISHALLAVTSPRALSRLNAWVARVKASQMSRLGHGGPGLSNAAFSQGVDVLKSAMEQTHLASLEFERARGDKTFTDYHGVALGQQLHRLCDCTDDSGLPEVHSILLKAAKGRTYAVLGSLFAQRAEQSPLPVNAATAPMATPKLVDDVFRNYSPGGDGLVFGKGLSPFAIVCSGHAEFQKLQKSIQQAQTVEAGASVSLADVQTLLSDEVRFPTQPFVAVEKLYGWSVVIDVFHGPNHPIAVSVREAVQTLGPQLQRLHAHSGDTPAVGMELLCRVLYDMQQDYYYYLARVSMGPAAVPDFSRVVDLARTYRVDGLSILPRSWYSLVGCPNTGPGAAAPNAPAAGPVELRTASSAPVVNPHADRRLMNRFKNCGHSTITAMIGTNSVTYPKHGGASICMAWALKGSCSSGCKRVAQHVRYGPAVTTALNKLLDDCGVAANPTA
jgi:hypothetical protein